jgi:capsid protein
LPHCAQLRRFTLAVISAAEAIANHAAVIETNGPAVDGDSEGAEPYDLVELNRNMATVLPDGYHLNQPKPEQPATTYGEFKKEILNEIARCLNLPFNVAACNSSSYNYASGRLDHQVYFKSLSVDRHHVEKTILDRIFREWFFEASGVYRWGFPIPSHCWRWDRFADIDPATEATARLTRLATGSSYATEMAEQGKDPDEEQRSAAKYLGVTVAGFQELLRQRLFANQQATSLPGSTQGESANGQTTAA